jgi:hypothetical protein
MRLQTFSRRSNVTDLEKRKALDKAAKELQLATGRAARHKEKQAELDLAVVTAKNSFDAAMTELTGSAKA